MTQIVYYKDWFIADKKVYTRNDLTYSTTKLQQAKRGDEIFTWAACGDRDLCVLLGDYIRNGFDEATRNRMLQLTQQYNDWSAQALLAVCKDGVIKLNLVSDSGVVMPIDIVNEPIVLGAYNQQVLYVWRVLQTVFRRMGELVTPELISQITGNNTNVDDDLKLLLFTLHQALRKTAHDQTGMQASVCRVDEFKEGSNDENNFR